MPLGIEGKEWGLGVEGQRSMTDWRTERSGERWSESFPWESGRTMPPSL